MSTSTKNSPTARLVQGATETTAEEQKAHVPTFAEAASIVQEQLGSYWSSPRTSEDWNRSMQAYVIPHIGALRVCDIEPSHVLTVLHPLWTAKHATARKLRPRISQVMRWAMAMGFRSDNPAEAITVVLPRFTQVRNPTTVVPPSEVAGVLAAVDASRAHASTKLAFEFLVLTAARSGEVRGARWDEMDVGTAVWTVPPERMKLRLTHRVPLSSQALALLDRARELGNRDGLVFPSTKGRGLSSSSLLRLLRVLGISATPQSFRKTFVGWCAQIGVHREVVRTCFSPARPTDHICFIWNQCLEPRRKVMEDWGAYVSPERSSG